MPPQGAATAVLEEQASGFSVASLCSKHEGSWRVRYDRVHGLRLVTDEKFCGSEAAYTVTRMCGEHGASFSPIPESWDPTGIVRALEDVILMRGLPVRDIVVDHCISLSWFGRPPSHGEVVSLYVQAAMQAGAEFIGPED